MAANPFLGAPWEVLVGASLATITFNSNGSFTMSVTSEIPGALIATIQGGYSTAPSPNNPPPNITQVLLTLTAQGNTVLFGLATFESPDSIIFGVGTQNIPGSNLPTDMPAQISFGRGV